eukprot:EG_transcript_21763
MALSLKKALRARMKTVIGALPPEEVHRQSVAVAQHLQGCPWWTSARSVGVYISFEGEIQTMDLITAVLERKAVTPDMRLFIPFIDNAEERSLAFLEVASPVDLRTNFALNKWGILEPTPASIPSRANVLRDNVALDAMLVPGLAFDANGGRLGRGKGYYDRFFARLRGRVEERALPAMPTLAGICFEEQVVDDVPMGDTDYPLDYVVCPSGVRAVENGRPERPL